MTSSLRAVLRTSRIGGDFQACIDRRRGQLRQPRVKVDCVHQKTDDAPNRCSFADDSDRDGLETLLEGCLKWIENLMSSESS